MGSLCTASQHGFDIPAKSGTGGCICSGPPTVFIGIETLNTINEEFSLKYVFLDKELGSSRFGSVILAEDKKTGDLVAVKVREADVDGCNARLTNESGHLQKLVHPNIITCHGVFEHYSYCFLVLPFCPSSDLLTHINAVGPLNDESAREHTIALLSAIEFCHSKRVTHRDLKLENLLLTEGKLQVADFETATFFHGMRALLENVGTIGYSSPQMLGGSYTHACDCWSCGVICYAILCGNLPFDALTEAGIVECVKSGRYSFSGKEWKEVSSEATGLVTSLLTYPEATRSSAAQALKNTWLTKSS